MATKKTNVDDKTLNLIDEVKKRKNEISKIESKSSWQTNCAFTWMENSGPVVNLHVANSVTELCKMLAHLQMLKHFYDTTAKELEVDSPFLWNGFTYEAWADDIKSKINKIQINQKKARLQKLEERLNLVMTPELRRQMELEAIEKELE